jgi:5S rRNA maturation endonuclease (ribonuclease M5)
MIATAKRAEVPDDILDRIDLRKLYPDKYGNPVMVHCSNHDDKHKPNLGVYPRNTYCFVCGFTETAFSHIQRVKGITSMKATLDVAVELCNDVATAAVSAPPLPLDNTIVTEYRLRLWENESRIEWLKEKYGLHRQNVRANHLGYTGRKPFAFTIPVYNFERQLINIRFRIDPEKESDPLMKYWGMRGHNQATLYYPPALLKRDRPGYSTTLAQHLLTVYGRNGVVLTEGEFDAMALTQIGIPAISATNGAKALQGQYEHLADELLGCRVVIAYDKDDVGEECATRVLETLRRRGITARVLEWDARLGKDASELVAKGYNKDTFRELLHAS